MEFYLLEDLDFHLVVFHPYRALLNITGREPADGGKYPLSRVEEDLEARKAYVEGKKAGAGGGVAGGVGTAGAGGGGAGAAAGAGAVYGEDEGEPEEKRIRRLMKRGTGEGSMEIDEAILQLSL